jgi:hypothetical protein
MAPGRTSASVTGRSSARKQPTATEIVLETACTTQASGYPDACVGNSICRGVALLSRVGLRQRSEPCVRPILAYNQWSILWSAPSRFRKGGDMIDQRRSRDISLEC